MGKDALHLNLTVIAPDYTDEELDGITRQLLGELREFDLESLNLALGESSPPGAKGVEAVTTGMISLAVLPTLLPKLLDFLQLWSLQGRGRTIKFKGRIAGQQIDFEGSFTDMEKLIEILEKKQKGRK
jgi:hypothetical protein